MVLSVLTCIISQKGFSLSSNNSDAESFESKTVKMPEGKVVNLTEFPDRSSIIKNGANLQITEIDKEPSSSEHTDELLNSSKLRVSNASSLYIGRTEVPMIERSWRGLNIISAAEIKDTNSSTKYARLINPPDVTLAVGKNHIAQIVHSMIEIWDKTGVHLQNSSLHHLFNISRNHYVTDPKIFYDNTAGHWFATIVDGGIERDAEERYTCQPICKVIVAVSNSNDPTQAWHIKEVNAKDFGFFPDQPNFTVNKLNFTLTTIEFQAFPEINHSNFIYRTYFLDKNILINENSSMGEIFGITTNEARYPIPHINPFDCSSTASAIKENGEFSMVESIKIIDYCDPADPANNNPTVINLPSKLYPAPKFKQPSLQSKVENEKMEVKILSAVRNNSSVWLALHSACTPIALSNGSCVNILRFDKVNAPGTVHGYNYSLSENTQFSISGTDVYYPSIGMSKNGKLFFISGFSNLHTFPSLMVSQLVSVNNTKDRYLVFGSGINNSTSFGDYFASAIDPVDGSVWLSGQYVDGSIPVPSNLPVEQWNKVRDKTWSTIIAKVS